VSSQADTFEEIYSPPRRVVIAAHTRVTCLIALCLIALFLLAADPTGTERIAWHVAEALGLALLTGACVWLITLPGDLFLARMSTRHIKIANGVFSYSTRVLGRKKDRYSVPVEQVTWEFSATKKDHFLRLLPLARQPCFIAKIPVRAGGLRLTSVKVACGLSEESFTRLAVYLERSRKSQTQATPIGGKLPESGRPPVVAGQSVGGRKAVD
jgi:hypothetical protein